MRATVFTAAALAAALLASAPALAQAGHYPMQGQGQAWPGSPDAKCVDWARGDYLAAELRALEAEMSGQRLGELSGAQLSALGLRLGLAAGKEAYLEESIAASFMEPGSWHLKNGQAGAGAGFVALHLGASLGSLVAAYFLLPVDLRFDRLDYLNSSFSAMNAAWNSHSVNDYLPAMGACLVGGILDGALRYWAARSAAEGARAAIEEGRTRIEPCLAPGFMGMGIHY